MKFAFLPKLAFNYIGHGPSKYFKIDQSSNETERFGETYSLLAGDAWNHELDENSKLFFLAIRALFTLFGVVSVLSLYGDVDFSFRLCPNSNSTFPYIRLSTLVAFILHFLCALARFIRYEREKHCTQMCLHNVSSV